MFELESEPVNIFMGSVEYFIKLNTSILFNFKEVIIINVPTRHFYSPRETKKTLLHLSPTSSKVNSRVQSAVTLVMDQPLEVMM